MKKLISLLLTVSIILSCSLMLVNATDDVSVNNVIEFTQYVFPSSPVQSGSDFRYGIIKNLDDLNIFLSLISGGSFIDFAEALTEEYFAEKALFIAVHNSVADAEYQIDSVIVEHSTAKMNYSFTYTEDSFLLTWIVAAEISQKDIADVEVVTAEYTEASLDSIEFTEHIFCDTITNCQINTYFGNSFREVVIQNEDDLNTFLARLEESPNYGFADFAASLPEDYFAENTIMITYANYLCSGIDFDITHVVAYEDGLQFVYTYSGGPEYPADEVDYIIAVELKKSEILCADEVFQCVAQNTLFIYNDMIFNEVPSSVRGDIDGDGNIETEDYLKLKKMMFESFDYSKLKGTDSKTKASLRADVNGDGKLSAADYMALKRYMFGKYTITEPSVVYEKYIDYVPGDIIIQTNKYFEAKDYCNDGYSDFFGVEIYEIDPLFSASTKEEVDHWVSIVGNLFYYTINIGPEADIFETIVFLSDNEYIDSASPNWYTYPIY